MGRQALWMSSQERRIAASSKRILTGRTSFSRSFNPLVLHGQTINARVSSLPNELYVGSALHTRALHGGFQILRGGKGFGFLPVSHVKQDDQIVRVLR